MMSICQSVSLSCSYYHSLSALLSLDSLYYLRPVVKVRGQAQSGPASLDSLYYLG